MITKKMVYQVSVTYNIEIDNAARAIDQVLSSSPVTPIAISAEPLEVEEDD
jgi:hypothetical protein